MPSARRPSEFERGTLLAAELGDLFRHQLVVSALKLDEAGVVAQRVVQRALQFPTPEFYEVVFQLTLEHVERLLGFVCQNVTAIDAEAFWMTNAVRLLVF